MAMKYSIKDPRTLRIILWLDAIMGGTTSIIGLLFFTRLSPVLGLTKNLLLVVSLITFFYSAVATVLVRQKPISINLLRLLVSANWFWTVVSIALLILFHKTTRPPGLAFLVAQIIVVGGLAYLEGKQIVRW